MNKTPYTLIILILFLFGCGEGKEIPRESYSTGILGDSIDSVVYYDRTDTFSLKADSLPEFRRRWNSLVLHSETNDAEMARQITDTLRTIEVFSNGSSFGRFKTSDASMYSFDGLKHFQMIPYSGSLFDTSLIEKW